MKQKERHHFAFFWEPIGAVDAPQQITIKDSELIARISKVVRLKKGDQCTFFNQTSHARVTIEGIERHALHLLVHERAQNQRFQPPFTMLLPLLKRDALSSALYHLVEAGITTIQLITTEKSGHRWEGERELARCKRILIAAAEQSKNFAFPDIFAPLQLQESLDQHSFSHCFYGDIKGADLMETIGAIAAPESMAFAIGPEGDFTDAEKKLLRSKKFEPVKLIPTVLRAETAAFYLPAIFRSVFN
jgi:16S rRNA (uracil1498-N3)-methyltransferase